MNNEGVEEFAAHFGAESQNFSDNDSSLDDREWMYKYFEIKNSKLYTSLKCWTSDIT